MGQWIKEKCVIQVTKPPTNSTTLDESYAKWCRTNRIPEIQKRSFLSKLRLQNIQGVSVKSAGGPTWVIGLRLKSPAELEMPYEDEETSVKLVPEPPATASNLYSDVVPSVPSAPAKRLKRVN